MSKKFKILVIETRQKKIKQGGAEPLPVKNSELNVKGEVEVLSVFDRRKELRRIGWSYSPCAQVGNL